MCQERKSKKKEKKSNPKIFLLTVIRYSEEEQVKMLKLNTIVEYMKKPFCLDDLSDAVKKNMCSSSV